MKKFLCLIVSVPFVFLAAQAGTITVTAPNGGENWTIGSARTITWSSTGVSGNVNIVLFKGTTRVGLIKSGLAVSAGSFRWEQAGRLESGESVRAGSDYYVRVRSVATSAADQSDRPFTLSVAAAVAPSSPLVSRFSPGPIGSTSVRLIYPDGAFWILRGMEMTFTWEVVRPKPGQYVKISVVRYLTSCRDESSANILDLGQVPVTAGHFIWDTAENFLSCDHCAVRLSPVNPGDFPTVTSSTCFVLRAPTSVRVLAPNGGETYRRGDNVRVRWEVVNPYPDQRVLVSVYNYDSACATTPGSFRIREVPISTTEFDWPALPAAASAEYSLHVSVVRGLPGAVHEDADDRSDSCFTIR